jgi:general nucleoside transport system permease protein
MDLILDLFNPALFSSALRLSTPIILAAMGGAICNRSGVLNLALEGKMLLGAFLGIIVAYYSGNTYVGILAAVLAGAALGAFFTFLYQKYKVNLVILAMAINMLVLELTVYFMRILFGAVGTWGDPSIQKLPDIEIPFIKDLPIIGDVLSGYNFIVYLTWFLAIFGYVVLFHTRFGRHIRAVGENKEAAESVGINSRRVEMMALVISGALAALGGAFLSVGHLTLFTRNMSNGRGWIGVSAALFGFSHPIGVAFSGFFFGFIDAFSLRLQNVTDLPPSLVQVFPHVATILALVLVALQGKYVIATAKRKQIAEDSVSS